MNHTHKITSAFILGAGHGTRMRHLTENRPKPLVSIGNKTIIDYILGHLNAEKVQNITVNTHYEAPKLQSHLTQKQGFNIQISHEDTLLDTGGGLKHALNTIQGDSFFIISGDAFWENPENQTTLAQLENAWDPDNMDILILLEDTQSMTLTAPVGDYNLGADGRAHRSLDKTGGYMFTSLRINKRTVFNDSPDGPFSYLEILDKAQAQGRLYGIVHQGAWHHLSTPEDIAAVNQAIFEKPD